MGHLLTAPQLLAAAGKCQTKDEAQTLVRREVCAMQAQYGSLMEQTARELLLRGLAYALDRLPRGSAERDRLRELFDLNVPLTTLYVTADLSRDNDPRPPVVH